MSLEANKVFAAVLTAGVVFMVSGVIGGAIVSPRRLETSAIQVATPEPAAAAAPAAPALEPIGPLLAAANADTGRQLAQRACASCHNFVQGGPNGVGPNLWAIVNRDHAAVEGFNYSAANRALAGKPWDYEALNAFIARPSAAMPGTRMAYAGMSSTSQRADLIAFLRTLSPEPAPLP
ncbi:c-type cytochrome [Falsiroseomonas sp. E2-1-a20]|uniref:c-type cytochrome n=1 Tax=Falsiroseomonas sp. E2-1-a20 TaxID=3239300 RepID=UPI003F33787F